MSIKNLKLVIIRKDFSDSLIRSDDILFAILISSCLESSNVFIYLADIVSDRLQEAVKTSVLLLAVVLLWKNEACWTGPSVIIAY